VLPTRNRPEILSRTLAALGSLPAHNAEVIIVDNASDQPPEVERALANGIGVRVIGWMRTREPRLGMSAFTPPNPAHRWIVMLDDDSHPVSIKFLETLASAPDDVLAVSADIHLPAEKRREDGGLPEVFIGCGVAIRRDAFLASGGYDHAFNYYVEEYDLAARLMLMGGRVAFDPSFVVHHHKVTAGRDMNLILERLVRNNGWVAQRYCPEPERRAELRRLRTRYRAIAEEGERHAGFTRGLLELRHTRAQQRRAR
jgi:GT2 family glycosyltransferase